MAKRLGPIPSRPQNEDKIDWQELEESLTPEERMVNVQNVDDSDDDSVVMVSVTFRNDPEPGIIPVEKENLFLGRRRSLKLSLNLV